MYNHLISSMGLPARVAALALRESLQVQLQATSANPLNRCGAKVFSQNDEDGITFEILRRMGLSGGTFLEFGVGNGMENNTLALLASGWRGVWLGGEDLAFSLGKSSEDELPRLGFRKAWITPSNCVDLARGEITRMAMSLPDLISIDLDGNDFFIAERVLAEGWRPKVMILEYNAKFVPPILFSINQDDTHQWQGDDYMGASLSAIDKMMRSFGYSLICCNSSGCNAFYIDSSYRDCFQDVPSEIERLYQPARYFMSFLYSAGHPTSMRTIQRILANSV